VTFYPIDGEYEVGAAPSVEKLLAAIPAAKNCLVPVRGYRKECSAENVEFVGIAA